MVPALWSLVLPPGWLEKSRCPLGALNGEEQMPARPILTGVDSPFLPCSNETPAKGDLNGSTASLQCAPSLPYSQKSPTRSGQCQVQSTVHSPPHAQDPTYHAHYASPPSHSVNNHCRRAMEAMHSSSSIMGDAICFNATSYVLRATCYVLRATCYVLYVAIAVVAQWEMQAWTEE